MFRRLLPLAGLVQGMSVAQLECTPSSIQGILPKNSTITFTRTLEHNSSFDVPPGDIAYPVSPTGLRAACAVQINVTSSPSSAFSFGLFLPEEWNERFLTVGNGGFAGGINWLDMGAGLGYGFAVASTDTGHNSTSGDISWALDEPEKQVDFGYRAMHGTVEMAKRVVEAYYGHEPKYSYYSGCSTGGRQGLKEVEMFPDDFDGVLAGAPAWWTAHLQTWTVTLGLFNLPTTAAHHIPAELYPTIGAEVLKQCDWQDGLVDNIVSDPRGCNFLLEALLCGGNVENQTTAACLTAPQLHTLSQIYTPYVETNDTFVFPGLEMGSEAQWPVLLSGDEPNSLGTDYVQFMVLNDSNWNFYNFNYSIVEQADRRDPGSCTADNFDIEPFYRSGGKLLMYHGEADALISTGSSIYFYTHVLQTLFPKGVDLDSFFRFFLVPGMQHCTGTPTDVNAPWYFAGANQAGTLGTDINGVPGFRDSRHDALLALLAWVEQGEAPDQIIATKWHNDTLRDQVYRQRPLCAFPRQARYIGKGSPDCADSWECRGLDIFHQQHR